MKITWRCNLLKKQTKSSFVFRTT